MCSLSTSIIPTFGFGKCRQEATAECEGRRERGRGQREYTTHAHWHGSAKVLGDQKNVLALPSPPAGTWAGTQAASRNLWTLRGGYGKRPLVWFEARSLGSCSREITYRGARGYSFEVLRHALVLLHVVVELLEGAVGVGVFYLGHVLVVCFVRLSVWLEDLDVVLHLWLQVVRRSRIRVRRTKHQNTHSAKSA